MVGTLSEQKGGRVGAIAKREKGRTLEPEVEEYMMVVDHEWNDCCYRLNSSEIKLAPPLIYGTDLSPFHT